MSESAKAAASHQPWLLRERTLARQKSLMVLDGSSSNLRWGPLFLLILAANTAVASIAWVVVGLFMN
jgi:hypothetical protein